MCDPMDCSPPGSSVHGILQARILEWFAIYFARGCSWPSHWTHVSSLESPPLAYGFFTTSASWEAIGLMQTVPGELAYWEVLKLIIAARFLLSCKVWYPNVQELVQGHPWEALLCPPYKTSVKKSLWVPPKEDSWEHSIQGDWTLYVWACVLIHTHTHTHTHTHAHFFPNH